MNTNRTKLSKSILEMKFMKKTKEKVEKQQFQEEGEEYFGSELTERMKKESERFIIEPSYVFCKNLIDGRLSYRGMNPAIEDLMQKEENAEIARLEKEKEADVSDQQMTDYWKGMKKKNEYKFEKQQRYGQQDEPPSKKPKFLKPQD